MMSSANFNLCAWSYNSRLQHDTGICFRFWVMRLNAHDDMLSFLEQVARYSQGHTCSCFLFLFGGLNFPTGIDKHSAAIDTAILVFADTSMSSYGTTVITCKGNQSSFVMSKSRVMPLQKRSRLELMATVIDARLAKQRARVVAVPQTFIV